MRIDRVALKHNSKLLISKTTPSPVVVGLVYIAVSYILNLLTANLNGSMRALNEAMLQYMNGNYGFVPVLPKIGFISSILILAISIMSYMLHVGYTIYCLKACQSEKAGFSTLMDGFSIFFKAIWLQLVMSFFIFLWSLLLVIPGIIAAYRYRQALYILIDDPSLGAMECISRSADMMDGRKMELFELDISFFGWNLLTVVPFVSVWVLPYTSVCYAYYYLALRDMPPYPVD